MAPKRKAEENNEGEPPAKLAEAQRPERSISSIKNKQVRHEIFKKVKKEKNKVCFELMSYYTLSMHTVHNYF
jgi:hypothetical protein